MKKAMSAISIRRLVCVALDAAERGGREICAVHEAHELNIRSKGGRHNLVTDGDMRSHRAIYSVLKTAFPTLHVISEEGDQPGAATIDHIIPLSDSQHSCAVLENMLRSPDAVRTDDADQVPEDDVTVWIDPLDATQEFTEGLLEYVTTMIGISVRGRAVAGVIHRPFQRASCWAWEGRGVSQNLADSRTNKSDQSNDEETIRLIVSSHLSSRIAEYCRTALEHRRHVILTAGGAGYKALQVALGHADVYVHGTRMKKWDLCAPCAIINALGGRVTTLKGAELDFHADRKHPREQADLYIQGGFVMALREHAFYLDVFRNARSKPHTGLPYRK